jgi:hypothetical protein
MIDEARLVPADRGVDHDIIVDREEKRVMPFVLRIRIARVGFVRRQSLAGVLDQPRTRGNNSRRERPEPLNRRLANFEGIAVVRQGTFSAFCST